MITLLLREIFFALLSQILLNNVPFGPVWLGAKGPEVPQKVRFFPVKEGLFRIRIQNNINLKDSGTLLGRVLGFVTGQKALQSSQSSLLALFQQCVPASLQISLRIQCWWIPMLTFIDS